MVEASQLVIVAVTAACQAWIASGTEIVKYNKIPGVGDCGETLTAGATGVMDVVQKAEI